MACSPRQSAVDRHKAHSTARPRQETLTVTTSPDPTALGQERVSARSRKEAVQRCPAITRYQACGARLMRTFDYLAAFSNAADWDPGVVAGAQLDPGPVGAWRPVSAWRCRSWGGSMTLDVREVIRFVPGREVLLTATSGVLRSTDRTVVTGGARRLGGQLCGRSVRLRPAAGARPHPAAGASPRGGAGGRRALTPAPTGPPLRPGVTAPPGTPSPAGRPPPPEAAPQTWFGPAVDAALEICVVPGFSRIGLAVRSALLPEFTAGDPPAASAWTDRRRHRCDVRDRIRGGRRAGLAAAAVHFRPGTRAGAERGPADTASPRRPAAPPSATAWPIWRTWNSVRALRLPSFAPPTTALTC